MSDIDHHRIQQQDQEARTARHLDEQPSPKAETAISPKKQVKKNKKTKEQEQDDATHQNNAGVVPVPNLHNA